MRRPEFYQPYPLPPLDVLREQPYAPFEHLRGHDVATRDSRDEVLQGTLDMLVLKALSLESMHGWGISDRLQQWSQDVLQLNEGSLYPALYRLERQGLVRSAWKPSANNRRARYYELTAAGRRQLELELRAWARASGAVNLVLAVQTP